MSASQTSSASPAPVNPPWPGTKSAGTATLEIGGRTTEFPVVVGTEGEQGIDIAKLRSATGAITLDEGFVDRMHLNPAA